MMKLSELGNRVCVIGPSNSGKSTLAGRLAEKTGIPVIYLDQLAHVSNTRWERRPDTEFVADHDRLIAEAEWIMDGNYSVCMPRRFARATSIIWIDPPLSGCLCRYILRSLGAKKDRPGHLQDAQGEFRWSLVRHILCAYPENRKKYESILAQTNAAVLRIKSMKDMGNTSEAWGLRRP